MSDLIERIRADREAGTPGPWVGGDDPDGEICTGDDVCAWICCVNFDGTTNAQASSDARRIARVPEMESRILADAEALKAADALAAMWEDFRLYLRQTHDDGDSRMDAALTAYRKARGGE